MWRGGSPFSLLRGYTTARVEVLPSVLCVKMSAISASEKVDGFTRKSVRKAQRQRRSQGSSQYRTQSVPVELSPLPQLKGTVRGWRSLPLKIGWHLWWPVSVLDQQQVHLLPERNQCKYLTQFRSAKNSIRFPIQRRHDSTCDFFLNLAYKSWREKNPKYKYLFCQHCKTDSVLKEFNMEFT